MSAKTSGFVTDKSPKTPYNASVAEEQKQCFSYVRFSSKIQAKGDSERRQSEIAPRVAKAKGWLLREDLNAFDLGLSAYHRQNLGDKGSIRAIVEGVTSGKIPKGSVMIIEAFDRLTRTDIDESLPLLSQLLQAGLEIYIDRTSRHLTRASLKDPVELTMALFELKGSYEYSAKLSHRLSEAWKTKKARASEKVVLTRMVPAWLDVDKQNNKFTVNSKAEVVNQIFTSYANGKGLRTIMRELNAEKIPTFGKGRQDKGNGWSHTHMRRLLTSRSVLGEYQPCKYEGRKRKPEGAPIPDYYPRIIEPSLFYQVQEIASKQPHAGGCKRNATNLFTGLVKCVKCGSSMVIKQAPAKGGKYHYTSLLCDNARRGCGCDYATLRYDYVERAVLSVMWAHVLPLLAQADDRQNELERLRGEERNTKTQIQKFIKVIEESESVPTAIATKIGALETKQAALARQIEAVSNTAAQNPLRSWKQVPKTIENRLRLAVLLKNEIESLTIDAKNRTATLKVKRPETTFEISWADAAGTNHHRKNEAAESFILMNQKLSYVDNLLVWESPENVNLHGIHNKLLHVPEGRHINVINPTFFKDWPGVRAFQIARPSDKYA